MRALDRTTHRGLWSALPTPWTSNGALDEHVIAENGARLADSRAVDGIYTTDSDGEFYAIELDVFQKLARAFGRAMEQATLLPSIPSPGTPGEGRVRILRESRSAVVSRSQREPSPQPSPGLPGEGVKRIDAAMGVTWSNTRGVIDRIKAACDAGIPNVHVAFPFFMPLAKSDVDRFFDDLAKAAPQARWIHYAHARTGPALTGADYLRLARKFPDQFIGTKLSCPDHAQLAEILLGSPELSHFVVDPIMLPGMMLGARGCCSYWVNTLPRWQRRYMDACLANRWDEARQYHAKLLQWELAQIAPLRAAGHLHGVISKARAALTGFLLDSGYTQPPYYPISQPMQAELKRAFEQYWADELQANRPLQETAT